LVEKYKPEIVYYDWWIGQPNFRSRVQEFDAFYYNFAAAHGYTACQLQKLRHGLEVGRARLRARPARRHRTRSLADRHIDQQALLGLHRNDQYQPPEFLIHQLIDSVSKNGNLLLNIAPGRRSHPEQIETTLKAWASGSKPMAKPSTDDALESVWRRPTKVIGGAFHDQDTSRIRPKTSASQKRATLSTSSAWLPTDAASFYAAIHALGSANEAKGMAITFQVDGANVVIPWSASSPSSRSTLMSSAQHLSGCAEPYISLQLKHVGILARGRCGSCT